MNKIDRAMDMALDISFIALAAWFTVAALQALGAL